MVAGDEISVMHDFTLIMPHRRPAVLMPTCGHAAAAACYYRREDVDAAEDDKFAN